ncbi:MAG: aspartate carbamoyltransferase catalytic subunit [Candidatus Caenarcaniphilales bacterium]|nr:aspartate carbamoyltransferase catalytic subunit [Candidatus Caenarcaniphilales bacterium]
MYSKHLISIADLSNEEILRILDRAKYWSERQDDEVPESLKALSKPIVCNLFFEPSTRTRFSFEVAAKKLNLHVLNFDFKSSSSQKGETFYDTVRTLEAMGVKVAIVRSTEENLLGSIADQMQNVALVNAGAGVSDHPTQALLDMMTIMQEFPRIEDLNIAIVGDVKHSRVARSSIQTLSRFGANIMICGPDEFIPDLEIVSIKTARANYAYSETTAQAILDKVTVVQDMDEAIYKADIVMMLRIQNERHNYSLGQYREKYGLTTDRARMMKEGAKIMHPAPFNRGVEIDDEMVEAPNSLIFRQVANGVAVRMAVLERAIMEAKVKV